MKKLQACIVILIFLIAACGDKNENEDTNESNFPVLSFIQSQVAHVDTSLYSILKITYRDTLHQDTSYLHREEFRQAASDFLGITDLTEKKYRKRYKEEKLFDETMNRVILRYTPLTPEKEDIQKQEILIAPDPSGDKVTSIFIDQVINNRDSSVHKIMLWQVDKNFTVTTILQKRGQPEITTFKKVSWNEESEE